jgi:hypothetical protein
MAPLAQELVALKPDVLMVGSRSGVLAAQAATRTIPIIATTGDVIWHILEAETRNA